MAQAEETIRPVKKGNGRANSGPTVGESWLTLVFGASLIQAFFEYNKQSSPVEILNSSVVVIRFGGEHCLVRKLLKINWKERYATEFIYFKYPDDPDERKRKYHALGNGQATKDELVRLQDVIDPLALKALDLLPE